MKRRIFNILLMLSACAIALLSVPTANADESNVAIVDIQRVVESSPQVKALKKSQEQKNKDIVNFIKNAQSDIKKQSGEDSKKKLAEKYEKQLNAKREANIKEYTNQIKVIDKSITEQIGQKAKAMGYSIVLTKSVVLYGGNDITEDLIKVIK